MSLRNLRANVGSGTRSRLIWLFVLVNIAAIAAIAIIWLQPAITSWSNARDIIARRRLTYATYHAQANQYPTLPQLHSRNVLPYEYLVATLYEIQSLARYHGLESVLFTSSEPVSYDTGDVGDGGRFVELRAIATFTGQEYSAEIFTSNLSSLPIFVRNMRIDFLGDGNVDLRVEFSLFARAE
ncbi:MAG: hypothetical protein FWC92_08905 [Defluviitaleaceae bacterium]|nr:hypothetical protein [Defluviitaleaceae bacterium]